MFSSTSQGGGVAEMMPRLLVLMREFGVCARWMILSAEEEEAAKFFSFTKRIHNNIHGDCEPITEFYPPWISLEPGVPSPIQQLTQMYEKVK
jgi:hypothetical protein